LDKAHFEITFQQFADVSELKVLQRSSFFITLSEKKCQKPGTNQANCILYEQTPLGMPSGFRFE